MITSTTYAPVKVGLQRCVGIPVHSDKGLIFQQGFCQFIDMTIIEQCVYGFLTIVSDHDTT